MGRFLGIDLGTKRIGLAISDGLGATAQGLEVLERKNKEKDFSFLKDLIKKYNIDKIIVGIPLHKDGKFREYPYIINFIRDLEKRLGLPVELWDERFTTKEAEKVLLNAEMSRKKRKKVIDKISAQLILQSYLDYRRGRDGL